MKSDERRSILKNKTDVKIFLLFIMNNLRYPLLEHEIREIALEDGYITGFDFAEAFSTLLEEGHILEDHFEDGLSFFVITPIGAEVAFALQDTLFQSVRRHSLHTAMRYLSLKRMGAELKDEIVPVAGGLYRVTCSVFSNGEVLSSFTVTTPGEEEAKRIRDKFRKKPEDVVRGLNAVATGDLDYLG